MQCPICYENIGDKDSCTTSCGHKFHTSCLLRAKNTKCPYCKTDISLNNIFNNPMQESYISYDDYDYEDEEYNTALYNLETKLRQIVENHDKKYYEELKRNPNKMELFSKKKK